MKKFKIGIALGGGGARGFANVGILEVLEQNRVVPDIIVGTSMGSIIGALYANELSIEKVCQKLKFVLNTEEFKKLNTDILEKREETVRSKEQKPMRERFTDFLWKSYIYTVGIRKISFVGKKEVEDIINMLVPEINIEDLKIPFGAIVTNLRTGEANIISKGSLRQAVLASSALPGIFPPITMNGDILVDGGPVSSVPAEEALRMGSDFVIGVDVRRKKHPLEEFRNAYEIISRCNHIAIHLLNTLKAQKADICISPKVHNVHWTNFKKFDWLREKGKQEAELLIDKIKKKIKEKKRKTILKRIFQ